MPLRNEYSARVGPLRPSSKGEAKRKCRDGRLRPSRGQSPRSTAYSVKLATQRTLRRSLGLTTNPSQSIYRVPLHAEFELPERPIRNPSPPPRLLRPRPPPSSPPTPGQDPDPTAPGSQ